MFDIDGDIILFEGKEVYLRMRAWGGHQLHKTTISKIDGNMVEINYGRYRFNRSSGEIMEAGLMVGRVWLSRPVA